MWYIIVLIGIFLVTIELIQMYLLKRNEEVHYFLMKLISMAHDYNIRRIDEGDLNYNNAYNWFYKKHSCEKLLYSIKPLKLRYWFTKEELQEINR